MTEQLVTSEQVRAELVEALRLDLVGPDNDHAFAAELLPEQPSRWYLTGFLVPAGAPLERRTDDTVEEEIELAGDTEGTDDATAPERAAARRGPLPSSMGLTALLPNGVGEIRARVAWGDYAWEGSDEPGAEDAARPDEQAEAVEGEPAPSGWRRIPRSADLPIPLPPNGTQVTEVPGGAGLQLYVTVRPVSSQAVQTGRLPAGARTVSVFLVNKRQDTDDQERPDPSYAFQASLRLVSPEPFVPRPDLRGGLAGEWADEWDELLNDLHYRDVFEYAVGHGISVTAEVRDGICREVQTTWTPSAEVERVAPAAIGGAELRMEELGALTDAEAAAVALTPLVTAYRAWIEGLQGLVEGLDGSRRATAADLLIEAAWAANRIEAGIKLLDDPAVLDAFRIANRCMARAARQREGALRNQRPEAVSAPAWRPFQLGFLLMTLRSVVEPHHPDREVVDLLFFPTGGGKTEAYLGLAAFTMVLRRFRNGHPGYAGLSVLMRYTLRLLTLDQLGRAAALVCALELEREQQPDKLGTWPFEIGLWVGSAATPNRMGHRGYTGPGADHTAYIKTYRYKKDSKKHPAPIPLENCPWCGTKFAPESFRLVPNDLKPLDLRVHCVNHRCEFCGDRPLPIVTVDEAIYRRLPAFLIATVDKFAALPWTGETGALFGLVDRYDHDGFYGPCQPGHGHSLAAQLPAPDLVVQDELHLISGPLGTIAGVYEAAIDALSTRDVDGQPVRPKIIASTATVRRADTQIRALFERQRVAVFPPPGPDRRDSFFAVTESAATTPARLYLGVAAPGRSLKVVFLRANLALLSAGQRIYEREGGDAYPANAADPYMTLVGYFNSLRELGGSRRIVEDEVVSRLERYGRRRRRAPEDGLFVGRQAGYEPVELTSRVSTNAVAAAKRRLALPFHDKERVDIALATNMISVGLDIMRLGLMVVLGQPKTSAEYIQATSRVGRDATRPGLVVTLLNVHKPRDRSHYERFGAWHESFYRAVEATSVTPFAPRALDRAMPAALVAMCRHGRVAMTPAQGAAQVLSLRDDLRPFAQRLADRARNHAHPPEPDATGDIRDHVLATAEALLDDWLKIAQEFMAKAVGLQYQQEVAGGGQRLLYDPLHPDLPSLPALRRRFRAARSMRDVEANVDLFVERLRDWGHR